MSYQWIRWGGAIQLWVALGLLLHGTALSWLRPEAFTGLIREDGPVEYLTAATLLAGALLALLVAAREGSRVRARTWLLIAAALLFGACEEISWGQRIFGWESPEWFQIHNAQRETNIHNLRFHGIKLNKWLFGKGLALLLLGYLGILPLLYPRVARVREVVDRIALPLARGRLVLTYLVVLAIVRVPLSLQEDSRAMEMGEMVGAAVFLSMLADPLNRGAISALGAPQA